MFLTRVWANGIIGVLEAKVLSGCGRNPVSQMTATGVPPTLVLANQMEALTEKVSELEESSVKRHEEFVQTVTEKFDQLPESISSHIRATLEITGAVAVTAGDVSNIVSSMLVGVQKTLLDAIEMRNTAAEIQQGSAETANNVAPNGTFFTSTWLLYKWKDGTEHYFPEDLIFPTQCSVILLWDLWHFGKSGISEAPYRKLQPMEIKTGSIADIRNQKTYFARAKKGMEAIENYAVKNAMVSKVSQIYAMSFDASRAIFNVSFLGLAKQCYNNDADTIMDQRRLGDITYLTFYDKIIRDVKRKASSIDN